MSKWVLKGLKTGKVTTRYPHFPETAAGVSPGLPQPAAGTAPEGGWPCPTGAIANTGGGARLDPRRCIHCFRCLRETPSPVAWQSGYEWGTTVSTPVGDGAVLERAFRRSLHIRTIDAGACGACMSEVKQTGKPHYNIHRLGFFFTPTPRHADDLLVMGPVPDNMVFALRSAYDAMPSPKRVVAVGTCALSGGVFGPSYCCGAGVAQIVPVDVAVPGCPPPPLAVIHGLLVATGRMPSATNPTKTDRLPERTGP